jgi:cytochrome c oxidase subunit 3
MSVILIFLSVIAAIVAWYLSQQRLTAKPWLEEGLIGDFAGEDAPRAKVGLGVFLAVVGCLFALFISAYFMRMGLPDWRPIPVPQILWVNTGALILSSLALQWALFAARREDLESVRIGVFAAGMFTLAFIAGQILAWRELIAAGYFAASNPANAFFYLITGVHGLHVLGGMVALGRTGLKIQRGFELEEVRKSLELCTYYWHFLLLVWLVLFALLANWVGDFAVFCRALLT